MNLTTKDKRKTSGKSSKEVDDLNKEKLICVPGQRLCVSHENIVAGVGTFESGGWIYASLAGLIKVNEQDKFKTISVRFAGTPTVIPNADDIVIAQVLQATPRFFRCEIICVRDTPLKAPCTAILRKEDIRATQKDRVEMNKCFRLHDIILARVLPLTELTNFQLSTAENELGVVIARPDKSKNMGPPMIPISWTEMQCPVTLVKEYRKVAKTVVANLDKLENILKSVDSQNLPPSYTTAQQEVFWD